MISQLRLTMSRRERVRRISLHPVQQQDADYMESRTGTRLSQRRQKICQRASNQPPTEVRSRLA